MHKSLKTLDNPLHIIPGQILCAKCYTKCCELLKNENDLSDVDADTEDVMECSKEEAIDIANKSLALLDCSPLKKVRTDRREADLKRKITDATSKIVSVMFVALEESPPGAQDCQSCNTLVSAIKVKMETADYKSKINSC